MKNKAAKQKSKGKGSGSAFGCDLTEHLQSSGHEVPQVLKSCAEFIEEHGIVDGIYRLSGITSNIQRLRQEFGSEACPDLTREVYLQDIHCVGSLCKLYFRELPNPLLTYELYKKFTDAVSVKEEQEQLHRIQDVIKELPAPHYRTLKYLIRHLRHLASLSSQTNMHARNLALVWAPNLLRSKEIEISTCNGDAAFLEVRIQQTVVEFILNHMEHIFNNNTDHPPAEKEDNNSTRKCLTLPASVPSQPMKLVSLEEAQARSLSPNHPARREKRENSLPDTEACNAALYHTVVDLPDNKRKFSGKSKRWKSIFNLVRSGSESKSKLNRNGSVFVRGQKLSEKASIRPAKSMDSLCSLPTEEDDKDREFKRSAATGGFFMPAFKSRTLGSGSAYDLSQRDPNWESECSAPTEDSPRSKEKLEAKGSAPHRSLPEQLKVFKGDEASHCEPTSPKSRRMFYSISASDGSSKPAFPGSLFPLEASPRHQRKALNISEPFAVSVPLRVSAVISVNSTPCRMSSKDKQGLPIMEELPTSVPCKEVEENSLSENSTTSSIGGGAMMVLNKEDKHSLVGTTDEHLQNIKTEPIPSPSKASETDLPGESCMAQAMVSAAAAEGQSKSAESWMDLEADVDTAPLVELRIIEPDVDINPSSCGKWPLLASSKQVSSCSLEHLADGCGLASSEQGSGCGDLGELTITDTPLGVLNSQASPPAEDRVQHPAANMQQDHSSHAIACTSEQDSICFGAKESLGFFNPEGGEVLTRRCPESLDVLETLVHNGFGYMKTTEHVGPFGSTETCRSSEESTSSLELLEREEDEVWHEGSTALDLVEPWEDQQWVTSPLHSPKAISSSWQLPDFPPSLTVDNLIKPNSKGSSEEKQRQEEYNVTKPEKTSDCKPVDETSPSVCIQPDKEPLNAIVMDTPQDSASLPQESEKADGRGEDTPRQAVEQPPPTKASVDTSETPARNVHSTHRPSSLNLDLRTTASEPFIFFGVASAAPSQSPSIQDSAGKAHANSCSIELEMLLSERPVPVRRNSAPVSVASVRTTFMVKTCQAKAVPVIPPKLQYTQIPQPLQTKNSGTRVEKEPDKTSESPSAVRDPKDEKENNEPTSKITKHGGGSGTAESPIQKGVPVAEAIVLRRKRSSNGVAFTDPSSSFSSRPAGMQKSSFRARPNRPQSLILFSPPFPIMDHPPSDATKLLLSPIKSPTDTAALGCLSKELAENLKTPEGVTLRSKMTLPKSGQRLETSTNCFYQPQRRSMIFDSRNSRQIE
ncbi:rho GTPase-activating protein 31 [Polypterus senegalus]